MTFFNDPAAFKPFYVGGDPTPQRDSSRDIPEHVTNLLRDPPTLLGAVGCVGCPGGSHKNCCQYATWRARQPKPAPTPRRRSLIARILRRKQPA